MVDYVEEEISAVEDLFPRTFDISKYVCLNFQCSKKAHPWIAKSTNVTSIESKRGTIGCPKPAVE